MKSSFRRYPSLSIYLNLVEKFRETGNIENRNTCNTCSKCHACFWLYNKCKSTLVLDNNLPNKIILSNQVLYEYYMYIPIITILLLKLSIPITPIP